MRGAEGGSGDGVGTSDELGHGEAASAGCDFVPRIEGWFGIGCSGAVDAGCGCECGCRDAVRFGRHCDGVGRGYYVFLLYFINFKLVKKIEMVIPWSSRAISLG